MPTRRRFYDPIVEIPAAPEPVTEEPGAAGEATLAGVVVGKPGLYLHVDDVVATLRSMAEDAARTPEWDADAALRHAADTFAQPTIDEAT